MNPLQKRLIFSAILIAISLYAIFLAPDGVFFLITVTLGLLALNEFLMMAQKKGILLQRPLGLVLAGVLFFSVYYDAEAVTLAMIFLAISVFNFSRPSREQVLLSTAVTIFGIVYVGWFFSHLVKIKALELGGRWVFYTLLIVKGGDAGAYFIGKRFGKVRLIEHVSPNKSVEGAIGGLATSVILSLLSKIYLPSVAFYHFIVLGLLTGVLAQLGDLAESLIKRDVGVKDSGHVPGLGGILDVLDSLLLSCPFIYYYITSFSHIALRFS